VPAGKYTTAGVVVLDAHEPGAHLPPAVIAAWMAAVSSVTPSPAHVFSKMSILYSTVDDTLRPEVLDVPEDLVTLGIRVKCRNAPMGNVL